MATRFFLLLSVCLVVTVFSAPSEREGCSSEIVLDVMGKEKRAEITGVLKSHKCSPPPSFESLYSGKDSLARAVGNNDEAQRICVGLMMLVKHGENGKLLDDVCSKTILTDSDGDYCQVYLHDSVFAKELVDHSESSNFPPAFIAALHVFSNLNHGNCNDICGGKKAAMCSVFIQLGMAFMKSKGPIEDNDQKITSRSKVNASHSSAGSSVQKDVEMNKTRSSPIRKKSKNSTTNNLGEISAVNTSQRTRPQNHDNILGYKREQNPNPSGPGGANLGPKELLDNQDNSERPALRSERLFPGGPGPYKSPGQQQYQYNRGPGKSYPSQRLSSQGSRQDQNGFGYPGRSFNAQRGPIIPSGGIQNNPRGPSQYGPAPRGGFQNNPRGQSQYGPASGGGFQNNPRGPSQYGPAPRGGFQNNPRRPSQYGPASGGGFQNNPRGPSQFGPAPGGGFQNNPRGPSQYGPAPGGGFQNNPRRPSQYGPAPGGGFQNNPRRPSQYGPAPGGGFQNNPRGPSQYGPAPGDFQNFRGRNQNGPGYKNAGGYDYPRDRVQGNNNQEGHFQTSSSKMVHNPAGPSQGWGQIDSDKSGKVPPTQDKTVETSTVSNRTQGQPNNMSVNSERLKHEKPDFIGGKGNKSEVNGSKTEGSRKPTNKDDIGGDEQDQQPGDIGDQKDGSSKEQGNKQGKPGDTTNDDLNHNAILTQPDSGTQGDTRNDFNLNGVNRNQDDLPMDELFDNVGPDQTLNNIDEERVKDTLVSGKKDSGKKDSNVNGPTKKPVSASSPSTEDMPFEDEYHGYGTWHFVSIFLIVSVIAIVGYFFVHNRKKLREQIAGKGRKKNYRPLSQQ